MLRMRRPRSLVDLLRRDLERDPGDAPALYVQDACDLQDLDEMPSANEPGVIVDLHDPRRIDDQASMPRPTRSSALRAVPLQALTAEVDAVSGATAVDRTATQ